MSRRDPELTEAEALEFSDAAIEHARLLRDAQGPRNNDCTIQARQRIKKIIHSRSAGSGFFRRIYVAVTGAGILSVLGTMITVTWAARGQWQEFQDWGNRTVELNQVINKTVIPVLHKHDWMLTYVYHHDGGRDDDIPKDLTGTDGVSKSDAPFIAAATVAATAPPLGDVPAGK